MRLKIFQILQILKRPKLLIVLLLGFSSGLPYLLIGLTLKAWLTRSGVDLKTVGLFAWVKIPYVWKFLWSPIFDRYGISRFGRRRSWMLISQIGLLLSLFGFSMLQVPSDLKGLALLAVVASFFSASQDIVIDAYRREILPTTEIGLGSSLGVFGYRLGTMLASAGAFILADMVSWNSVYAIMAGFMLVGIVTTLLCPEPTASAVVPMSLRESVVGPLKEFFNRDSAWVILSFVFLYKVGESMANEMYNSFYIQLGFTNTEIGEISKFFAVWAMIIGGVIGGALMLRLKTYKSLWIFGILQGTSLLLFSILAQVGHSRMMLATAIGSEYFTSGMATSAFVAFMSSQANIKFTAVQYSLLSSLGVALPSVLLAGSTGYLAESLGWTNYFIACSCFTIPGLLILFKVKKLIPAEA